MRLPHVTPPSLILSLTLAFPFVSAQPRPANLVAPPSSASGALSALKYTKVGGTGTYDAVTDIKPGTFPNCDVNPFCVTESKTVSGNLAPFDDELTVAFRGPMNIHNIAVYQPGSERGANASSASWKRVSVWAAGEEPENLVFMNNMGGGKSGEWSICSGASQSYASGDWTDSASVPNEERAKGVLDEDHEINIMTAESCATRPCTGFSRGTAHHGWGGSKLFVFTFDMPPSSDSSKAPAIWALNAQIVRAAQYGCNCRGVGPGGCGELDILETLPHVGAEAQGISEIYGPKGATGSGARFFARPTGARATYGVIFDVRTDAIAIQEYEGWDYGVEVLTRSVVDGYLGADAFVVPFEGSSGKRRRDSVLGAHRRRRVSH